MLPRDFRSPDRVKVVSPIIITENLVVGKCNVLEVVQFFDTQ